MGGSVSCATTKDNPSAAEIPEELIKSEILTRLPVISIVRFRCVCKSWKLVLSGDPDFVQSHLTHSSLNLDNGGSLIARSIPLLNPNNIHPLNSRFVELGGSVNGLVCVYSFNFNKHSIQSVGLWNPATNLYKNIPVPPSSQCAPIPGIDCFCLGVGFDPIANDYKVIYFTTYLDRPLVADVYSCNSDSWGVKCVTSTFVAQGYFLCSCPTVVHGRPYWYDQDDKCPQYYNVTFFDVQDEVFRLLPRIDFYYHYTQWMVMVNLRDSLAFMLTDSVPRTTSRLVDVYVFDEKFNLWTKNYTIGPITIPKYMALLHCFRNGDLLFKSGKYIKLVGIHPQTHAVDRFASGMYRYNNSSRFNLVFSYGRGYIESLVSVKGMSLLHVPKVATDILVIEKCF